MVNFTYTITADNYYHFASNVAKNGTEDVQTFIVADDADEGSSTFYAYSFGNGTDGEIDLGAAELPYGWTAVRTGRTTSYSETPTSYYFLYKIYNETGDYAGKLVFEQTQSVTITNRAAPCFVKGTKILCADGEMRAVETLRDGDLIKTLDNGDQPIRWVGKSFLNKDVLDQFPERRPLRIAAGTFGNTKDTYVSPQHRMLITDYHISQHFNDDEVLVPAKALIDDENITVDMECENVTYYHILMDKHQIICGDGAWSESFKPGKWMMDSMNETTRNEVVALFPMLETNADDYSVPARELARPGVLKQAMKHKKVTAYNIAATS